MKTSSRISLGGSATAHASLEDLLVDISTVTPHPDNPRNGDVDAIVDSIRVNGLYRPVYVQASTMRLLAGNHTYAALMSLGATQIPIVVLDVNDEEAKRIMLVDNRSADLGNYDEGVLLELLQEMQATGTGLLGTGYDNQSVDDLLASILDDTPIGGGDPDAAPALPAEDAETITQRGDVWLLGPHRLLVGDCTDPDAVRRLVGDSRLHAMWTDPPYGVDYVGGYSHQYSPKERLAMGGSTIANDGELDLPVLLDGFLQVAQTVLRPGAAAYIAHPAGPLSMTFGRHIQAAGWSLRQQLIWVKDSLVMGRSDYHYRHEPIWMAYTPVEKDTGRLGRGGDRWYGDNTAQSIFEVARPKRSEDHPTMKPVDLIVPMLANSAPKGGLIYDPFAGSGSTLIAAHTLNMAARLVELDPRYADVICRRFQTYCGTIPVHEAREEQVSFLVGK